MEIIEIKNHLIKLKKLIFGTLNSNLYLVIQFSLFVFRYLYV